MNETLTLTEEQANALLDYLASKPYGEVFKLVNMLQGEWSKQHSQAGTVEKEKTEK